MTGGVIYFLLWTRLFSPAFADVRCFDFSARPMPVKPHHKTVYGLSRALLCRDYFNLKHARSLIKETKSKPDGWHTHTKYSYFKKLPVTL